MIIIGLTLGGLLSSAPPACLDVEGCTVACERGQAADCLLVGQAYATGDAVPEDAVRAATFFERACSGGSLEGCWNLGQAVDEGQGATRDVARAAALFEKACARGEGVAKACNAIGYDYDHGEGVAQDRRKALGFFEFACRKGEELGCRNAAKVKRRLAADAMTFQLVQGGPGEVFTAQGEELVRELLLLEEYGREAQLFGEAHTSIVQGRHLRIVFGDDTFALAGERGYVERRQDGAVRRWEISVKGFPVERFIAADRAARVEFRRRPVLAMLLEYEAHGDRGFELKLNGRSAFKSPGRGGFVSGGIPVNRLLRPGKNELTVLGADQTEVTVSLTDSNRGRKELAGGTLPSQATFRADVELPDDAVLEPQRSIFDTGLTPGAPLKFFPTTVQVGPGVRGVLRLNGFELARLHGKSTSNSSMTVSGSQLWLRSGGNDFELTIDEVPAKPEPGPLVQVALHGMSESGFPGDENQLFAFEWPAPGAALTRGRSTFRYSAEAAPPSLLWKEAAVLSRPTQRDEAEIRQLVERLHRASAAVDAEALHRLDAYLIAELARSYGEADTKKIRDGLVMTLSQISLAPFAADALRFQVIDGRVVHVTTVEGLPALRGKHKVREGSYAREVFVAKIGGTWTLVR